MKKGIVILLLFISLKGMSQELYVFTEPASNMPAHSISLRLTGNYMSGKQHVIYSRLAQRYTPEIMFGLSKKLMIHTGVTLSNMHTSDFRWESVFAYSKYRFFSNDDVHKHFRMAVFGEAAYTRSPFHYDEINLNGDKSGVQLGLIATQLWNKLAVSGTVSHTQVLDKSRYNKVLYIPARNYQSVNYSLSAGYLLLPVEYKDYNQLNVNLYAELLAQQALDTKTHFVDLAPAIQFIFNSNFKVNIGHRFELTGDMERMGKNSWQVGLERTFLNAIGKRK